MSHEMAGSEWFWNMIQKYRHTLEILQFGFQTNKVSFLFPSAYQDYVYIIPQSVRASPVAQMVKNPPAMLETWVQSLGWEYPLEKQMETHCSIPAWRIPQTEEPGGLQSMESQSRKIKRGKPKQSIIFIPQDNYCLLFGPLSFIVKSSFFLFLFVSFPPFLLPIYIFLLK